MPPTVLPAEPQPPLRHGDLRREWPLLAPSLRRRLARGAALAVHQRLEAGGSLDCALEDFRVEAGGERVMAWPPARGTPRRMPVLYVLEWLSREWDSWSELATPRESVAFAGTLLRLAGAPRKARRSMLHRVIRAVQRARHRAANRAARLARQKLRRTPAGWTGAVEWPGGPGLGNLLASLESRVDAGQARRLKRSPESDVLWIPWDGRPVLAKWYPADRPLDRFKDVFRPPRALRAWCAAFALRAAGVPCPAPLAIALNARREGRRGHWFISEAVEGAVNGRRWIKPWLHRQPDGIRREAARRLLRMLDGLERAGLVHGDTKASNLLVRLDASGLPVEHWWIDLEAVRLDVLPSPRRLERNLIQLNGSLGRRLSREDRLAFLADYARGRPWAADPALAERVERVTRLRLDRERRRECGS